MNTTTETKVNFYASLRDYAFAEPYAVLSHSEVTCMLQRFDRWTSRIAAHPSLANVFGDSVATPIKMVTALRMAVRESKQAGLFPNVIFSHSEYQAAMSFLAEAGGNRGVSELH